MCIGPSPKERDDCKIKHYNGDNVVDCKIKHYNGDNVVVIKSSHIKVRLKLDHI